MRSSQTLGVALAALLAASLTAPARANDYRDAALAAERWLDSVSVESPEGRYWPVDPEKPEEVATNLYSGTSGVVLFYLEAYHVTGKRGFRNKAREGADYLIAKLPDETDPGLYDGVAGIGFALTETHRATKDERYRAAAKRTVELLRDTAGGDPERLGYWNETTDIVSGTAGTGLYLLYAGKALGDTSAIALAALAGLHLLEHAEEVPLQGSEDKGLRWPMNRESERLMPNFSHGTAGVAYFLARLYEETGLPDFLEAAVAGARHLQSIADTTDDACLIMHHTPGGEDLHYLSWCHGPAGTARLFYQLARVTEDDSWMEWVHRSARAIEQSGIPQERTEGFWNNVGQCCGSAGVGEFFLNLYHLEGEAKHLDFARRMSTDLLERATREGKGLKWIQAEHRVQPDLLQAQTGFMQGAAGIGFWFLKLYAAEEGKTPRIRFPDAPY